MAIKMKSLSLPGRCSSNRQIPLVRSWASSQRFCAARAEIRRLARMEIMIIVSGLHLALLLRNVYVPLSEKKLRRARFYFRHNALAFAHM
jgi:hypothetical protein